MDEGDASSFRAPAPPTLSPVGPRSPDSIDCSQIGTPSTAAKPPTGPPLPVPTAPAESTPVPAAQPPPVPDVLPWTRPTGALPTITSTPEVNEPEVNEPEVPPHTRGMVNVRFGIPPISKVSSLQPRSSAPLNTRTPITFADATGL